MIKRFLFLFVFMFAASAIAGGTIFSRHKTSNPRGVSSVGIYICGSLNCPDVIIKEGSCDGIEHATMKYGVCVCDEGWKVKDGQCIVNSEETNCAPSNCMNCETDESGQKILSFLPAGTPCEQGGLTGVCNDLGQCMPQKGNSCDIIGEHGCEEGYFCNYGGWFGQLYCSEEECKDIVTETICFCAAENWDGQKCSDPTCDDLTYCKSCIVGLTPNVCEKANPRKIMVDGTMYYFTSAKELKSFCRPADGGLNCTWGYLSWYGAQSYCQSLGKRLLTHDEINDEIISAVVQSNGQHVTYWVQDGIITFDETGQWSFRDWLGRPDGYAFTGAALCK